MLGALVVGVFVGGFFVSIGVSILLADTPLAVAVAPLLAYVGTPCLFGGLTIWAGMTWLDRRERDRNRPPRR